MRRFTVCEWSVDPSRNRIERQGVERRLTPRVMDLLVYLAERSGEVVSSEQILGDVWPDEFVGDHALLSAVSALRKAFGDDPRRPKVIKTIPKRGYSLIAPSSLGGAALAVLPLENLSRDPEQDFFADGMTAALISELGRIPALRVISRHSVMTYRGSKKPLPEIARELDVRWILEGSVASSGGRVRITAQLIEAAADRQQWAESYERELRDALRLQREIAGEVAGALSARLQPVTASTVAEAVDPEALIATLRGRFHFFRFSPEHFDKALAYFHEALERSPDFAPALAGVADVWGAYSYWGIRPAPAVIDKAREFAKRAVAADPENADAQMVVGLNRFFLDHDLAGGEAVLRHVTELDPNHVQARIVHAICLDALGWHEEAALEVEVAVRLDPLNPAPLMVRAWRLARVGSFDRARTEAERIFELAPEHPPTIELLADIDWLEGKNGIDHERRVWRRIEPVANLLQKRQSDPRAALLEAARAVARSALEGGDEAPYVAPLAIARLFLHGGDPESAMDWLERGLDEGDLAQIDRLIMGPTFLPLKGNPRHQALLDRLGFAIDR